MTYKINNSIKKSYKKLISSKSKEEKQFFDTYGFWPKHESLAKRAAKDIKAHKIGEKGNWQRKTNEDLGIPKNSW